jgi:hypothetical protein
VPLADLIDWLVALAPAGVVEFVPKADPMVQRLLRFRDDIFGDYSDEAFCARLQERAEVVSSDTVSASGRKLFWYVRRKP